MPYLIDSHEDFSYNMLNFGRDYRRSVEETRRLESTTSIPQWNGQTLLGAAEYQQGQVRIIFSTLFLSPRDQNTPAWEPLSYPDFSTFRKLTHDQIDAYERLWDQSPELFAPVRHKRELHRVLNTWEQTNTPSLPHPTGMVMLIEGAEGISNPAELEEYWHRGVRMIGLVWGGGRLCGGTRNPGKFTSEGLAFLDVMAEYGFTLDISHMSEESALEALDRYEGPVAATHANARALLRTDPRQRHLSDIVIRQLVERDGVMGVIPFNHFLNPDWSPSDPRESIRLEHLAAHIDHVCQLAGNSHHVGIGTDFDGGFGYPAVPLEINTIADLQKLDPILQQRGYSPEDVQNILGANWLQHLERTLPA